MDQAKIGRFLKELRLEQGMTQEELAAQLGVSNRTVSRWENGVNMPDLDLMREIGTRFHVGVEELLDGCRKEGISPGTEEALHKAAEYSGNEKSAFANRLHKMFLFSILAMLAYLVLDFFEVPDTGPWGFLSGLLLGIGLGALILGALHTSGRMGAFRAFKRKLVGLDQ